MSAANDTGSKIDDAPCQSSWECLRAAAASIGTKYSDTEIKPVSLLGVYYAVWDSYTMLECMDDIGEEESWIKLSIKNPENLKNANFADIEGRFRWWRKVGSFKGLTRAENSKENLWLVNGVTWSALVDVDDDDGENPYEDEDDEKEVSRAANDFGLACLGTLDSAGNPFFEMLYNTGQQKNGFPDYVRVIWKKQKEGCRSLLMLSNGEARRLVKDGAADLSETRNYSDFENENEDSEEDIEDEDAEGDLDEGLETNNLKRRAEADEEEGPMKRHRK